MRTGFVDPESNTLRTYYPDFLAQKTDGSYVIVEIKGENKIVGTLRGKIRIHLL